MNEQQLQRVLSKIAEDIAPTDEINVWPVIEKRLAAQALNNQLRSYPNTRNKFRQMAWVMLAALLIGMAFLATPQGRVWAQEFMQFFTRTRTDTLPVQPWQLTPQPTIAPSTAAPDPASILEAKLSVNEVKEQSGFAVKEPTWMPKHLTVVGATYDPQRFLVRIFYRLAESNGLVLKEEFYSSPDTCVLCNEVGASASVERVQIGNTAGEYVQGVWKLTENGPIWENDPYLQTLRWQVDGIAYELQYMGPPDMLTKDDLVKIASSLQ